MPRRCPPPRSCSNSSRATPRPPSAACRAPLTTLNADVAKFGEAAQRQFKAGIERSASKVRSVVTSIVITALIVILALAVVSWFVVRTIWQQLGGEPEYAREIARGVAAGDLSMEIRTEKPATPAACWWR
jgi:methyl-accepting chemotaxis protein